ncbi:Holliday junction resolvase [Candidatus Liberibacter solanacearum]|uniref:Putative pre-16S rRNA nuclease n=1 Tax=Candidatus Liberibacter solanacearum TaxID=556287 RepID=A0A095BFX2_9HYPH|nr:Holliday junction resolvase RuvX [Candidatus Liberibacter solanacearum]KGB27688.1 Holliday junction resolvase [Candidatus Liberibacter solanacearum]KJZ81296.1 Holliday junction resolvase [Candidatus Liberibacter solanacearum]KJZ82688.1 putative Holliday junction resolvase [Candidatus Liberibacter solanacearum]KQC49163.1 Holliday junction resolvase [Candidatus Liberibacter solanacearum]
MSILLIEDLVKSLKPNQPIASIDLGTKKIGIAISDLGRRFAHPRPFLIRKKITQTALELLSFATTENIAAFVIGLPLNMNGSEGPRVQSTRAFVQNMIDREINVPFIFWDERLTTVSAQQILIDMDVSRKKRAQKVDSIAASLILQEVLDRISSLKNSEDIKNDP